jgi:hypothetical protein
MQTRRQAGPGVVRSSVFVLTYGFGSAILIGVIALIVALDGWVAPARW